MRHGHFLGFDPSTKGAAWALLRIGDWQHRELVRFGIAADDNEIARVILAAVFTAREAQAPLTIGVEIPSGLHTRDIKAARARAVALMATTRVAGYVVGAAQGMGLSVTEVKPEVWRRAIVNKAQASDAQVKLAIQTFVRRWPARSNNHVRDAAGVALFVALAGAKAVA